MERVILHSDLNSFYASGDTSKTDQMATLKERSLDYAFFCCDGRYNMDIAEAVACANLVGAKHSIPYHCIICPRRCGADRIKKTGFYGAPRFVVVLARQKISSKCLSRF